ncbi:MAG TPA: PDZ domain-containing protein [Terriglobales bacterium]|nr:PDZ domain-containing protein [Terriglobales bacterium]
MPHSILLSVVLTPLLGVAMYAAECPVFDRLGGPYSFNLATDAGFSGDEESTGAYLGVDITDVTTERLSALKLKDERGVEVTMVDQDAPAGKAGLKEHDVILTMNGANVDSGAQLRRMIRETPPGRVVAFGVSRDGQPVTIKVPLADRRKSVAYTPRSKDFKFEMPPMPPMPGFDVPVSVVVVHSSMRSGLMVENITPQLREFFGVKTGTGVLIRSVEKGSRAEKSGFRAGDVIVRVNDQSVADTSDFSHAIGSSSRGTVTVGIIRDKKEQNLTLPLPERKDSGDLIDESFDGPDIDVQAHVDVGEVRKQMARIQPQMEFALQESRRAIEQVKPEIERARHKALEEIERQKPEIERALREAQSATEQAQRELCNHQKALRQQMQNMQKQLQKQQQEILRENKKQLERIRHEVHGDWMQI